MSHRNLPSHIRPLPGANLPSVALSSGPSFLDNGEAQLREYWRVLLKYRVLIAACTFSALALGVLLIFIAPPIYTATTKIRISTYQPLLAAAGVEDVLHERSKESNYLETHIQEIRSYSLADRVLGNDSIREALFQKGHRGDWWNFWTSKQEEIPKEVDEVSGYRFPIQKISGYLNAISVSPIRRTSLVLIHANAQSAHLAAQIANTHSMEYREWVRENWVEQQSHSLSFLRSQASTLREKVVDLERELAEYAEENSIVAVNKDENITVQQMAQLATLLTETTARRISAEDHYEQARKSLSSASAGFDDESLKNMRTQLALLEAELSQMRQKFTGEYPKVVELRGQIDGLQRAMTRHRKEVVEGLRSKAEGLREEEIRVKAELERQKSKAFELSKKEVHYNVLKRELESSRELLQSVLKQVKETALAVEGKSSNVSIVDYAVIPTVPSFPRKKLVIFVSLIGGLVLGIGLAFLLNHLDNTIRTPEELMNFSGLPSLGVVPSFELLPNEDKERGRKKISEEKPSHLLPVNSATTLSPIIFESDPKSLASEAYRTIRTGILLSQAGEPPRTLLFTSAESSEGKTTTTANLAASLAGAGGRVVLIDADLRRPFLGKHFGLPPGLSGLVEVITGQERLDSVIQPTSVKRVSIVPAGRIPPNPAELLGSVEMASLIDQLSSQFDYVLIDSPPILPVTDSVILSRYVDGVVMILKGGSTPKRILQDAKSRLERVGARILGIILNDINFSTGDYYYYNRYYNTYYQSEGDNGEARHSA